MEREYDPNVYVCVKVNMYSVYGELYCPSCVERMFRFSEFEGSGTFLHATLTRRSPILLSFINKKCHHCEDAVCEVSFLRGCDQCCAHTEHESDLALQLGYTITQETDRSTDRSPLDLSASSDEEVEI